MREDDYLTYDDCDMPPPHGHASWRPIHRPGPCRWPVWERQVSVVGEARIFCSTPPGPTVHLVPLRARFSSPPALDRQVLVCGYVDARLIRRRRQSRRVALPFQAVFPAWPARSGDYVHSELVRFSGVRVCPIRVTTMDGYVRRACDLKVFLTVLVRVCRPVRYGSC